MKTHQEKLNELTTEIRKAIPRLMELSDGCEIKIQYDVSFFITGKAFDTYYAVSVNGCNFKTLDSIDIMEKIGHEPLLNDVLQWLKIIETNFDIEYKGVYAISCYGNIFCIQENINEEPFYKTMLINWDLSKSKLSDQSPELINFLHDLIPNK